MVGVLVGEDVGVKQRLNWLMDEGDAISHGRDEREQEELKESACVSEENEEGQDDEEGVAHAGVLEKIDIAPKSSDEEGDIANHSQHSVHSDHQ